MAKLDIEKMAREVAQECLDTIIYDGKTFREWLDIISQRPLKPAHWIPSSVDPADPYFRCSNCHHGRDTIYFQGDEYNFCPHCGAKMDGDPHDSC